MDSALKRCIRCFLDLPLGDFYRDRARADGLTRYCKACSKEKAREWASRNVERGRVNGLRWREENRERRRIYKLSRRDIEAAWMREKRRNDPEFRRRQYESFKAWLAANRDHWNEKCRRRDALKRAAAVGLVNYVEILGRHGAFCHICGLPILDKLEFDHVIPLNKGGAHSAENIRPAHKACNSGKRDHLIRLEQGVMNLE